MPDTAAAGRGMGGEVSLAEVWQMLVRNRWLVAGTCALVLALAAAWTSQQPNVYESAASLRIDQQDPGLAVLGDLMPMPGVGKGKMETEMFVLRSRAIAERVADSLQLALSLVSPRLPRDQVIRPISMAAADGAHGLYTLRRRPGGSYTVEPDQERRVPVRHDPVAVPGTPFRVENAVLELDPGLRASGPDEIRFAISTRRAAVNAVRAGVRVSQPEPNALVVVIGYKSTDPVLAAAVPNALATAFIQHKSAGSKTESRSAIEFLRQQVSSYESDLASAENRLQSFRESAQVVSLPEEASAQVRRLTELQATRDQLRSERDALSHLLNRVTREARTPGATSPYRQLASFPVFLSNRAVQDMLQSLTTLENERAKLLVQRTSANEDVQGLERRIAEIEEQLHQIARNYLDGVQSQIASAETVLSQFATELEQIPAREVEFARLQRQQVLLDQLYTLLQTRLKEAEIREAVEPGDVRIIDPAMVPERPVAPRPMRTMILAAVLGLALGCGLAFGRHALDHKVRTRDDVTAATAGAPILAMIPRIDTRTNGNGAAPGHNRILFWQRNGTPSVHEGGDRLVTMLDPRNAASEAYRALRTSITFSSADRAPQMLVVTSAMPGEGKSTSASNLAITMAQQGTRTLLIDADLRRGLLHTVFGVPQEPGLSQVLLGRVPLDEAVREVPSLDGGPPLYVLTTGVLPPNPAELLGSSRMADLVRRLRQEFEMIIVDAPPLNLVTDGALLGKLADATLLVARSGATDKRALHHAAGQIAQVGATIGGVVLNDVDAHTGGTYYGYGYGYGYGYAAHENGTNGKPARKSRKRAGVG